MLSVEAVLGSVLYRGRGRLRLREGGCAPTCLILHHRTRPCIHPPTNVERPRDPFGVTGTLPLNPVRQPRGEQDHIARLWKHLILVNKTVAISMCEAACVSVAWRRRLSVARCMGTFWTWAVMARHSTWISDDEWSSAVLWSLSVEDARAY